MYIDDWGNKYKTYNDASKGVLDILYNDCSSYIYESIAEYMNIPFHIFKWLLMDSGIYNKFKMAFKEEIKNAEENICENYFEYIEENT